MYGLGYEFRFIDPIKTELNQSKPIKILELFGLTLNTANIETQSIGTATIGITNIGTS